MAWVIVADRTTHVWSTGRRGGLLRVVRSLLCLIVIIVVRIGEVADHMIYVQFHDAVN
jgi:hypothetical protein